MTYLPLVSAAIDGAHTAAPCAHTGVFVSSPPSRALDCRHGPAGESAVARLPVPLGVAVETEIHLPSTRMTPGLAWSKSATGGSYVARAAVRVVTPVPVAPGSGPAAAADPPVAGSRASGTTTAVAAAASRTRERMERECPSPAGRKRRWLGGRGVGCRVAGGG